jgi:hypothetical protein
MTACKDHRHDSITGHSDRNPSLLIVSVRTFDNYWSVENLTGVFEIDAVPEKIGVALSSSHSKPAAVSSSNAGSVIPGPHNVYTIVFHIKGRQESLWI